MTTHQPQVGDTITTAEELDELFSGTVVLDSRGDAYLLGAVTTRYAARNPPLTILYLPGQPPRPERVVKAEALREAAANDSAVEAAATEAFWTDDMGGHHKPGRIPHTWRSIPEEGRQNYRILVRAILAATADHIARGDA